MKNRLINFKMKRAKLCFMSVLMLSGMGAMNAQYTVLENFNGAKGSQPIGTLTLSGNRFYGTTNVGGLHDSGCVFSIDTNGSNYKDIFDFNGANGNGPVYGSLALSGGRLYGMTNQGGAHSAGCIYKVDTNGNNYKDLLDFNGINGSEPAGSVIIAGSKLFGISQFGGAHDSGCVFSLDTNGNNYKDLLDFTGKNGQYPRGSLLYASGVLYGMVNFGVAPNGMGGVFSLDTNGSNYKNLYGFSGVNGKYPFGDLILSGKVLFGMTSSGGTHGDGNIFSIDTTGGQFKNLYSFTGVSGNQPNGDLTMSAAGVLFGMTSTGGAHDSGCIFSIDTTGLGYTDLFDFDAASGVNPYGSLTLSGTTLFGTASLKGANNDGVIFRFKDISLSVAELTAKNGGVNVYPNPSNGLFTISLSHSAAIAGSQTIEVYNVLGAKVYSQCSTFNAQLSINLNQPNGIYLYRVISQGNLIGEGKLVIQK